MVTNRRFFRFDDYLGLTLVLARLRGIYIPLNLYLLICFVFGCIPYIVQAIHWHEYQKIANGVHPLVRERFHEWWFGAGRLMPGLSFIYTSYLMLMLLATFALAMMLFLVYRRFKSVIAPSPSFPEDLFMLPYSRKCIVFAVEDWPVIKVLLIFAFCFSSLLSPFWWDLIYKYRLLSFPSVPSGMAAFDSVGGENAPVFIRFFWTAVFLIFIFSLHRLAQVLPHYRPYALRDLLKRPVPFGVFTFLGLSLFSALLRFIVTHSGAPAFMPALAFLTGLYVLLRTTIPVPEERCWPPSHV